MMSTCCNAPVRVESDDIGEGLAWCHYVCTKCGEACWVEETVFMKAVRDEIRANAQSALEEDAKFFWRDGCEENE